MAAAARRVRDPVHGQQRACGLRGLACRAAVRGARLQDADRPADLQPLAGPRLRPDGQRPRVRGPVGPGPADLLLSLLRADAARRRDRPPSRSRLLPGRQRLHRGVLGTGPGRDRPGPDRAAGVLAGPGPDGDRRLRAGPDLRPGGHRVRGVRRRAGQSHLPGHIRAGSAAGREERRSARRGHRLDRAARRGGRQPVQPVHHVLSGGIGPAVPRRSRLPRRLGRRLDRHRAGRTGRGRPGQRHARAYGGYHRGRGDRDGLGLAGRLGEHRPEHHHQHPHRRAERHRGERRARAPRPGPAPGRPCPRATATCISRWSRGTSSCRSSAAPS